MDPRWDRVRSIVRNLIDRCAVCGERFEDDDLQALGRTRTTWAFRLTCRRCGAASLVAAVIGEEQLHDVVDTRSSAPVSERDVEEMRAFLEQFDGDFQRLFGYTPGRS
ncbi:MAG: hypothetical protein NZL87_09235 [Thermomicrobium sp.]|nr:hypothetical protein [Thermomicrobium sp.]MCS7246078.1 hypothetical protein [Thermomicrobium sp.]MDW7981745.1 hypothetical protein [Thermomicrobium sp.]